MDSVAQNLDIFCRTFRVENCIASSGESGVVTFPGCSLTGGSLGVFTLELVEKAGPEEDAPAAKLTCDCDKTMEITAVTQKVGRITVMDPHVFPANGILPLRTVFSPFRVNVTSLSGAPVDNVAVIIGTRELDLAVTRSALVYSPNMRTILSGNVAISDADGIATFSGFSIAGAAGPEVLMLILAGSKTDLFPRPFAPGLPVTTPIAGQVASVAIVVQPSRNATDGQPFAVQPRVQVRDAAGNPLSGVICFARVAVSLGYEVPLIFSGTSFARTMFDQQDAAYAGRNTMSTAFATASQPSGADGIATFSSLGILFNGLDLGK